MCSSILLQSLQGDFFWGRTMDLSTSMFHDQEYGNRVPSKIINIPANLTVPSQTKDWQSTYATLGVGIDGTTLLYDGINECGLTGDLQVLMECSRADQASLTQRGLTGILGEEVVSYVLTTCKDATDVKNFAKHFGLLYQPYKMGSRSASVPAHYVFVDEKGQGVVLEPTDKGAFKVYDYVGVMTNSPEYDYHKTNIRNYIALDNFNHNKPVKLGNHELQPIEGGTAFGMMGLPGDYSSPSRFVRAMFIKNNIDPFNSDEGMTTLYNCFKTVMIPKGLSRTPQNPQETDYTQYWTGYDLANRTMYLQDSTCLTPTVKKLDQSLTEITYQEINLTAMAHVI